MVPADAAYAMIQNRPSAQNTARIALASLTRIDVRLIEVLIQLSGLEATSIAHSIASSATVGSAFSVGEKTRDSDGNIGWNHTNPARSWLVGDA
jgi:hypothetical protein